MENVTENGHVEITDYTDYIPYIANLVEYKRNNAAFSLRVFCRKSGFRSPNYLKWVIDGTRPISTKSVHKFAAGLSLDRHESQYFTLMVNYKEAADPNSKRYFYEQMLTFRKRESGSLTKDAYEYLSHWYYVAIRELVAAPDFTEDAGWIRKRLGGGLTPAEIKNGLETLERLGLVMRDDTGRLRQAERDLHTEREVQSLAAYNYHDEMLELSGQILARWPAEERDYQSLVALVDREAFAEIKRKIASFQKSLVDFIKEREQLINGAGVQRELYAFNTQLFPLGARTRKEGL